MDRGATTNCNDYRLTGSLSLGGRCPDDRRKIAATQAYIPQFPIVKLIELADLCCCPVACRQSGRKATQLHPDP